MHLAHLADQPRGDPLGHLPNAFARVALIAHLAHDAVFMGRLGQNTGFEDGVGDRLLHVDVLAAAHALHRHVGVRMVGRGDDHRVDVLALIKHLAEIGEEVRLGELLNGPGAATEIQITEGDDIFIGGVLHVAAADAAETDRGDTELLVRGFRLGRGIEPRAARRKSGSG